MFLLNYFFSWVGRERVGVDSVYIKPKLPWYLGDISTAFIFFYFK